MSIQFDNKFRLRTRFRPCFPHRCRLCYMVKVTGGSYISIKYELTVIGRLKQEDVKASYGHPFISLCPVHFHEQFTECSSQLLTRQLCSRKLQTN